MITNLRSSVGRISIIAVILAAALPLAAVVAPPLPAGKGATPRMLDARVNLQDSYRRATAARPGKAAAGLERSRQQVASITAAVNQKKTALPGLQVRISNITAGPELVRNTRGPLTAASTQRSEDIVRGFLAQNGGLYGLSAADLSDLVVLGDSAGGLSGMRMLRMEQRIDGRPVFQSETRFVIDRNGRLMGSLGRMVPAARAVTPATINPMTPIQAVMKLVAFEGKTVDASALSVPPTNSGDWIQIEETDDYLAGTISARQVLFPLGPGQLVPAWAIVAFTTGDADWYAIVDAETGDVLWRKNIRDSVSIHDARFRVFVQADGITPASSPAPSTAIALPGAGTQFPFLPQTIVSMHTAMNPIASPNGWIDDCPGGVCTAAQTQTLGNNTVTCMDTQQGGNANVCDTNAAFMIDGNGRPTGNPDANARNRDFLGTAPRDFQTGFVPPPQTTAADAEVGQSATGNGASGTNLFDSFRRGAVTHLFYMTNWYHDRLFTFGFDEASGNFQQTNFSGMGLGGDRVNGDAEDGSGTNNANFATPPDGVSGRMQMYRFTADPAPPAPQTVVDRDGGLDAEVAMHEMTHGTSNRLVGNGAGLNWDPAGGMGEGWSDFYALSLLNNTNASDPNGRYASGAYATYKLAGFPYTDNYVYGIRRFPYSTDNSVNPLTWADIDDVTNNMSGGIPPDNNSGGIPFNDNGGMEVHNIGEVWALSLWEVRSRVIADPAGANGDVPTGNTTMLQLVTDGLKMTPVDPSFTDARDAVLNADCATNACANEPSIWGGFSDRGLGYGAFTPYNISFGLNSTHMAVRESFSVPYIDVVNAATDVAIDDSASNNNGKIDPGEAVRLTVSLTNPWRSATKNIASATATLTTSTPGVTIYDNTATWGAIAAQSTVAASDPFTITVDPSVACGSSINFTLTTTSSLGTTVKNFSLRVGNVNGTDPVVTYMKDTTPDLAIPDGLPRASVFDTLTITDDFQIADLDFRLDSVTHTFTGDLSFMLRSPGAIGNDLVALIGALIDGGSGDNIANMVIDDEVPATPTNDMVEVQPTDAPYTKSWTPLFNAPWTTPGLGLPPDTVGELSRFDGTSTLGTWTVAVSDQFSVDTGTLNAWSLLVTPTHFDCVAFAPGANLTATKIVSGAFQVNGTVAYIVTITNNGTANQTDNAGNEFTDVLPASLTLVGATGTSGSTVATVGTNTVTWNGSLAPLGGSVTITITATVNVGTQNTVISNQGTLSYDGNNDGTNEATGLTDDPAVGGATDPTNFTVAPCASDITVTPVPAQVCGNSSGNTASGPAGAGTYSWSITNGTIIGSTTSQSIVYTAGASGTVNLTLTTTDAVGCHTGVANVPINPIPATPTITPGGPTTFCNGGSVTLTSSSATGNQWYLNGNPIGGATNQTYVATTAGDYSVVVTNSGCSSATSAAPTVAVNPNPNAAITAPGSVSSGSTGNVASVANAGVGATYAWGITNGTITGGAGTSSITFTAGGVGTITLNVTVTTSAGCSDSQSANVASGLPAVTVTSVSPNNGTSFGGTSVTINGTGFQSGATVTFGGTAATNVVFVSATQITAKTPAHAVGPVNVTVTNPDTSTGTLNNGYTYNVQRFDPNGDNTVDAADVFYLVNYLYLNGPAPAGSAGLLSGDANGDSLVDPSDIFYAVNYLFSGGPHPDATNPGRASSAATRARMTGSVSLGQAVQRDGHWIVPVIVAGEPGMNSPQALSLAVRFDGDAASATIHRVSGLQPAFEISRNTGNGLAYLVAFGQNAPLSLGSKHSTVIAEIEIDSPSAGLRLEIDSTLTMLVDQSGTQKATVENGGLQVRGTMIGRPELTPRPKPQNHD